MKRADGLRPLSREHLVALTVAKRMRDAESLEEARSGFLEFWAGDGRRHFRVEEEVLLPFWSLGAAVDREAVSRMLDEHLELRVGALRLESGECSLVGARELGQALNDHVRFEERELFPLIEADLDDERLNHLGAAIEAMSKLA